MQNWSNRRAVWFRLGLAIPSFVQIHVTNNPQRQKINELYHGQQRKSNKQPQKSSNVGQKIESTEELVPFLGYEGARFEVDQKL